MSFPVFSFPPIIQRLLPKLEPWLPVLAFASGAASFILVDRQAGLAKWIVIAVLAGWIWLLLENVLSKLFTRLTHREVPPVVGRLAVQWVHQESFFFVLPFFYFTTTWNSGQAVFTGLLAIAGLLSIIDPFYLGTLARRKWLLMMYHGLAVFALTLTSLPIIFEMTTGESYYAAIIAVATVSVLTLPGFIKSHPEWQRSHWMAATVALPLLLAIVWWGRYWVPPAGLWLEKSAITTQIYSAEKLPGNRVETVSAEDLHSEGLYAYAAIRAPLGLRETIYYVWLQEGEVIDRIPLAIEGGREEGYRSWTHKLAFPEDAAGEWEVQLLTEHGQMIGVLKFEVE
ncbi:DUF5924 family protein [Marinobacter sp.]|uniref:DUF5924 family protein n=1 Tax=Marinobacter sp. TaxID=50741 RepID=UPI00384E7A26